MKRILFLVALLTLGGCATAPRQVNNVCAVFDQRGGWFNNWQTAAVRTSREFGVPVPVLMATIYTESGFQPYARPPRTKILWIIPWKRPSSAWLFAGPGWYMGSLQARNRPLERVTYQFCRRNPFYRLVSLSKLFEEWC